MAIPSIVCRAILKSLRLAPSTATPIGMPSPSTNRLRLTPNLPRSVGFLPVFFPPEGCLGHAPIHRQPGPVDSLQLVILQQPCLPQLQEHAGGDPLLEAVVCGGTGADAMASNAFHWQPVRSRKKMASAHTRSGFRGLPPPKRWV